MSPSWWPSGWKIGSRLRQLRLPRIEILVIVAACVVAFVITLSVLAGQSAARSRRDAELAQAAGPKVQAPRPPTAADLGLGEDDFLLPSFAAPAQELRYVPFRPRRARWSAEEVARYWVAPRQIATDLAAAANDRAIQQLFQDVP